MSLKMQKGIQCMNKPGKICLCGAAERIVEETLGTDL